LLSYHNAKRRHNSENLDLNCINFVSTAEVSFC